MTVRSDSYGLVGLIPAINFPSPFPLPPGERDFELRSAARGEAFLIPLPRLGPGEGDNCLK